MIRELNETVPPRCSASIARPLAPAEFSEPAGVPNLSGADRFATSARAGAAGRVLASVRQVESTDNSRYAHPDEPLVLVPPTRSTRRAAPRRADTGDTPARSLDARTAEQDDDPAEHIEPEPRGDTGFVNTRASMGRAAAVEGRDRGSLGLPSRQQTQESARDDLGERPDAADYYRRLERERPDVRTRWYARTRDRAPGALCLRALHVACRRHGTRSLGAARRAVCVHARAALPVPLRMARRRSPMWTTAASTTVPRHALPDVRRLHRTSAAGDAPFYRAEA